MNDFDNNRRLARWAVVGGGMMGLETAADWPN